MTNASTQIHYLCPDADGNAKVSVYLRTLRKSPVYYARYKITKRELANGQRFITESLKTDNLDRAIAVAQQRYAQLHFAQESNIGLKDHTTEDGIRKFLENYERNVDGGIVGWSRAMMTIHRLHLLTYWLPYLGQRNLNSINLHDLDGYETWRRANNRERCQKRLGNMRETLARTTINQEIGSFKHCLRWLKERNVYSGSAHSFIYKVGEKTRRSAFTVEQYRLLIRYMRKREYSKQFDDTNGIATERYRQLLRTYILFMANTGLRVGEARHLKWGDIEERSNRLGGKVIVARVSKSHSKVKKSRQAVGRVTALRALERWKDYLDKIGERHEKETYVFCDESGKPIHSFLTGFNTLIKNAGVEHDAEGVKHTIYTLRHTYITFRLMFGKNINIYHLAENCGTSVEMIQQYYSDARPEHFVDELSI